MCESAWDLDPHRFANVDLGKLVSGLLHLRCFANTVPSGVYCRAEWCILPSDTSIITYMIYL